MQQIEYACKELVFHFNKKHLEDATIPMWVVKCKGESYYVHHVSCSLPWSTKETPDNTRTKGSIKLKECLLTIDDDNCAAITALTEFDKIRLHNRDRGITRIIFRGFEFERYLKEDDIKHSPFKRISAGCGSTWTVCDILRAADSTVIGLKYPGQFRVLKENEDYYRAYDDKSAWDRLVQESDDVIWGNDDEEEED